VANFWTERYNVASGTATARSAAVAAYYRVRPLIPRRAQIAARRLYSRVQARSAFPRWPVEGSLHGFCDLVAGWLAELAGEDVPRIGAWPNGRSWALVLTHDVETADGLRRIPELRDIELAAGFRSSWNLVPRRYHVPDETVAALRADGFEIGLHGLYHDGHDLSAGVFERRLPEMRRWAQRWGAVGFRAPATQRDWETMASLPFEYDSSYPDTDPFEPQPGGCGSWLPYLNGDVVELPITLPQDHTVFLILRRADASLWTDKIDVIRAAGGMALLLTHPDYAGLAPIGPAYRQLLDRVAGDSSVWRALPAEVSRWWRRRAQSCLERDGDGWRVAGPAQDEASVQFTSPRGRL
jgi:peptidoglycan/xylan/chitin deacetylase (PgdA/CDA1 family)